MPEIDLSILYFFNRTLASPVLDAVMSAITSVRWWLPVYVIAGIYLLWKHRLNGVIVLLGAVLVVAFSDQLAQLVLKPLADRARPCAEIDGARIVEWIRLPNGMRHGPSFPSSHALNNAAVAVFFGLVFRNRRVLYSLLCLTVLVGISRVYLGVHYPSDILGGLFLGAMIGFMFARAYQRFVPEKRQVVLHDKV